MTGDGLPAAAEKMRRERLPEPAIATFCHYYEQLLAGESGLLEDGLLEPVRDLPRAQDLEASSGGDALARTVVIKLNGGLGTSMGMSRAKSLIEAREGLSFLDLIARQVLALRRRHDVRLPLVLMNSFHTRADSLAALERYRDLESDVPADFLQHKQPKLRAGDLRPVAWPSRPELEWCPPGHGDLYTALATSGMLDVLLAQGYRYAFVSNADNLGAVLDPAILDWFAAERLQFLMEVVVGTAADRKGGHLARRADGHLVLRETAQTPPENVESFRDYERWRYYNTNNLWLDLATLADVLAERDGVLGLPLIVNRKTVDPADPASPAVLQLETAMGAAIGVFDGAGAVCVPRSRFAPVKTTNDLLALRSDAYEVTDGARVELVGERGGAPPFVDLDPVHHRRIADFAERFAAGAPSLVGCDRLVVRGDVSFGANVFVRGSVELRTPPGTRRHVEDGTVLAGEEAATGALAR
jgi:UTP--glucose-1-phosphate uridylyltransferase